MKRLNAAIMEPHNSIAKLIESGKSETALSEIGTALKSRPQDASLWLLAALASSDKTRQIKAIERAIQLDPNSGYTVYLAQAQSGQLDTNLLNRFIDDDPKVAPAESAFSLLFRGIVAAVLILIGGVYALGSVVSPGYAVYSAGLGDIVNMLSKLYGVIVVFGCFILAGMLLKK